MPGDYQWSLPQFPIIITWNGSDTFWKLGVISRHLSHACDLFEEVEEDISLSNQPILVKAFGQLRNQTVLTQQIVGDKVAGQSYNIPPVEYHARKGSATDLTYRMTPGTKFVPMFRHDISRDPQLFAPKTTSTTSFYGEHGASCIHVKNRSTLCNKIA